MLSIFSTNSQQEHSILEMLNSSFHDDELRQKPTLRKHLFDPHLRASGSAAAGSHSLLSPLHCVQQAPLSALAVFPIYRASDIPSRKLRETLIIGSSKSGGESCSPQDFVLSAVAPNNHRGSKLCRGTSSSLPIVSINCLPQL